MINLQYKLLNEVLFGVSPDNVVVVVSHLANKVSCHLLAASFQHVAGSTLLIGSQWR